MKKKILRGMGKHEQTVDWLVNKLIKSGKYDFVEKDVRYNLSEANGQIDVMAYLRNGLKNQRFYFFEVKSSYNKKSLKKAQEQYDRYKNVHHHKYLEGYIVTPNKMERLNG